MRRTKALDGYRSAMGEAVTAGFYDDSGDADSTARRHSASVDDSVWANVPMSPSAGIYSALNHNYVFITKQDVDTTDLWNERKDGSGGSAELGFGSSDPIGHLVMTTDDSSGDFITWQGDDPLTTLSSGRELWFEGAIKVPSTVQMGSDQVYSEVVIGLANNLAVGDNLFDDKSDFVGFQKADRASQWTMRGTVDGNSQRVTPGAESVIVFGQWVRVGFHYDGANSISFFNDGEYAGKLTLSDTEILNLSAEPLYMSLGIRTGERKSKEFKVDRVAVVRDGF